MINEQKKLMTTFNKVSRKSIYKSQYYFYISATEFSECFFEKDVICQGKKL